LFAAILTPARWVLLWALQSEPTSIYQLAKRLGRDYKNVHIDVSQLLRIGLVERRGDGVAVAWDRVRAELELG
jgi:predicted transcriptional regulator